MNTRYIIQKASPEVDEVFGWYVLDSEEEVSGQDNTYAHIASVFSLQKALHVAHALNLLHNFSDIITGQQVVSEAGEEDLVVCGYVTRSTLADSIIAGYTGGTPDDVSYVTDEMMLEAAEIIGEQGWMQYYEYGPDYGHLFEEEDDVE